MAALSPHFVLFSESRVSRPEHPAAADSTVDESPRYWHFVLRSEDGEVAEDVWDEEADASEERLALLAVVRGLEAIPEPAQVTLVTQHAWIRRGLRFGLDVWRENHWRWERFGAMAPIKHGDLWRRIDRALQFHEVQCCGPLGSASRDDLSSPSQRAATNRSVAAKRVTRSSSEAKAGPAATGAALPGSEKPGPADLLRRLFGWCRLCRPEPSLLMAAR